jgi:poly-gamma-glutamate capsule biosynthesis protein CapA/YwtB (metallophosphatase superfamily)
MAFLGAAASPRASSARPGAGNRDARAVTLCLGGDVMTGRGIDQILPHSAPPRLHEPYMKSAAGYVELAERVHGAIPRRAGFDYIWGDALEDFRRRDPDVRIVNLETAVTTSDDYWRSKGIHYRMHPGNVPCLAAAGIDFCALANNHVLDWGYPGLEETLDSLADAGIATAGAGRSLGEAQTPATLPVEGKGRVLVFSFGTESSGIPRSWAAAEDRAGVNLLPDLSPDTARSIGRLSSRMRRERDWLVASIHWGGNWGYAVPEKHRDFAHALIDEAGFHVVHGHSSHHAKGIEVRAGKPILYGCGDLINDYEGIRGHERFRPDLPLLYFTRFDVETARLREMTMVPYRIRRFRLRRASRREADWLAEMFTREGRDWGTAATRREDGALALEW